MAFLFTFTGGARAEALPLAPPGAVVHAVSQTPQQVVTYWTPERLRNAPPIDFPTGSQPQTTDAGQVPPEESPVLVSPSPPAPGSAYAAGTDVESLPAADGDFPQRIHGKIFATLAGAGDFSCSGTVVSSPLANLIVTAGHCVHAGYKGNQFATNFVFVPAYRNGAAPLGVWPAAKLYVPPGWTNGAGHYGHSDDIGMAQLSGRIQDSFGARGIAFHLDPNQAFLIYGYPASPSSSEGGDYDGQRLIRCDARYAGTEATGTPPSIVASPCYMEQGASGGGWVTGGGAVNSVVSHSYCDYDLKYCGNIYGPYFGQQAEALYQAAIAGHPPGASCRSSKKAAKTRKAAKSGKTKSRARKKCKKKKRKRKSK